MLLAAPVGVIELDEQPGERCALVNVLHGLLEFMFHPEGGISGDAKMPGKVEGGDPVLGLGDQVDTQEPDGQRQIGRGKERTGNNRGLAIALFALEQFSRCNGSVLLVPAARTDEPVWPAQVEQCCPALLFCAV